MTTKALVLPLETVALETSEMVTGYYIDPSTGRRYYYDAAAGQWYLSSGVLLIPLETAPLAWEYRPWTGTALGNINVGDVIRVTATFRYAGPERSRNIRISLFHYEKGTTPSGSMNEVAGANATRTLDFGPYSTPHTVSAQLELTVGSEAAGRDLGVYAKFTDVLTGFVYQENCTYGYYGIASVIAAEGDFSDFEISSVQKV